MNNKSLVNNTLIYAIGNIGTRLISFLMVPIYTFFLTTEELGYYDLIISTISLIVPVVSLQIETAVLRWMLDSNDSKLHQKIVTNSFIIISTNIIVISAIYFVILQFLPIKYSVLIWLLASFQIFHRVIMQVVRGLGSNVLYMVSGVLYSFLLLVLNSIFIVVLNFKVEGVLLSATISTSIIILLLVYKKKLYLLFDTEAKSKPLQKEFIVFSLPLIPNSISWWAISGANRYIIFLFIGASANGLFAIAIKFSAIIIMINGIFNLAWQESAITNYNNDKNYYSNTFKKYVYFFLPIVLVLLPSIKFVMRFMVQEDFMQSWSYVPILILSSVYSSFSSFLGVGYLVSKDTKGSFISVAGGGVITIILSLLLIPYLELWGASIALLIGYIVVFLIRVIHVRKYFHIQYPIKFLIYIFILFISFWMLLNYDNIIVEIILIFISSVFTLFVNWSVVKSIYIKAIRTILPKYKL